MLCSLFAAHRANPETCVLCARVFAPQPARMQCVTSLCVYVGYFMRGELRYLHAIARYALFVRGRQRVSSARGVMITCFVTPIASTRAATRDDDAKATVNGPRNKRPARVGPCQRV